MLSLGETHSFELASVARFLNSKTVEDTLDPGDARLADVHGALALERQHLARHPPQLGRQAHAAAASSAWRPRI